MILWIFAAVLILLLMVLALGFHVSEPGYHGSKSPHFDGKTFVNEGGVKSKGLLQVARWLMTRDKGSWSKNYEIEVGPKPVEASENLRITFVNHCTFLIQWNQLNILTDPIWSERCSPFEFIGPQRMRPAGIRYEDLPHIDMVIVSHNHYDHLDLPTLLRLEEDFKPLFIVPVGVSEMLSKKKIKNTAELDWWEQLNNGINVTAVPAQHFSGRGMIDRDQTLWCGYLLEHDGKKLYFVGDTGYGEIFKEIGKKAGPIDVSLISIGAYLPRWFMSPIHISPAEAVKIHIDVKSKQSIAMHFGTFPLADEGEGKAEEDLILALDSMKVPQKNFVIPTEGTAMDL